MEKFLDFRGIAFILIFSFFGIKGYSWGFFAHKNINRLAVFTLPAPMAAFYKANIEYLIETAVLPDKRRYIIKEEAPRHYIDLEYYLDSGRTTIPLNWQEAKELFPEDSMMRHGVLPWHLELMKKRLTEAFIKKDCDEILKLSAEIGHYLADAHVPLHTTRNYNGQLTNQHGIHGLWESRLPELYFEQYDFFVGPASYLENTSEVFNRIIMSSNSCVDSVLQFEKAATAFIKEEQKYSFEDRGTTLIKVYSREFCLHYHSLLSGQVERRMRDSVKTVGSIWYTCWVDAGRPDLKDLITTKVEKTSKESSEDVHENCVH